MADSDDLRVDPEDAGVLFRAEMALTNFVMKYWPHIVAVVGVFLVGTLVYGLYANYYTASQRRATAAIADVEAELPANILALAQSKMGTPGAPELDLAKMAESAADMMRIADGAGGAAAIEGYLKAAELYRLADDTEGRRKALEAAASSADGVLAYAASAGLANLSLQEGNTDDALSRFRELARADDVQLAREGTLDLASALEAVGRNAESVTTYDDYLARWPDAANVDDVRQRRDRAASGAE